MHRVCDVFHDRGFASLRWCDDEASLSSSDRAEEVYESAGGRAPFVLECVDG